MPDGSLSSEEERWWGEGSGDGNNWMGCNDGGGGGIRIVTILPIETS